MFKFSTVETNSICRTWKLLNFCIASKSMLSKSSSNQIEYNQYAIEKFVHNLVFINGADVEPEQLELIRINCPLLIQIFTNIIHDLESTSSRNSYIDLMTKFSKINARIYQIEYQNIGDCFISTIMYCLKLSNHDQFMFLKFLNVLLNRFQEFSEDPTQEINDYDYRLSYSDSNLSNLSLVNEDVDLSMNETITSEYSGLKKSNSLNQHAFDNSVNQENYSIDIDELDNLNEDNDFNELESKYEKSYSASGYSLLDDDEDDDAFDYLNSFAESKSHSKANNKKSTPTLETKKLKRRLSTINMKPSKSNLTRVQSNKSTKQDCTIM